ncbi:MAG: hypothetical protein K9G65_05590 [Rickettsiaceae bacterium]|nr:hypothetical protein [Rickettsiaceae bacterium]
MQGSIIRLNRTSKQMKKLLFKVKQRINNAVQDVGMLELPEFLLEKMNKATKVLIQSKETQRQLLVWHAPEVECIGKGKARTPFEFGCKVSLVTNVNSAKGGHFILSAQALHGRPYDGHTLAGVIDKCVQITKVEPQRIYIDKGYKGHNYEEKLRVFISGQRRGVHGQIKRELKRRSVIEPIISHAKFCHKLNRP